MTGTTRLREGRGSPSTQARLLSVLAMAALLAGGCGALSGPPSAAGIWEGEVVFPDEGTLVLALDLQQSESGGLSGTMRYLEKGASPDEVSSMPVSGGSVTEDGSIQVVAQSQQALEGLTMNVQGSVEGDVMDAQLDAGGPRMNYDAERIGEEEYRARLEERRQAYEADQERQRQAAREQSLEAARYEEAAKAAGDRAQDIEQRLAVIEGPYGGGPAEQLRDALGPEDPGGDLHACSSGGGAACEVAALEERLAGDREDVAEAEGDDYAPSACDTVDFSYYEDYDFAEVGGAEYTSTARDLRRASEGLAADADEALEKAREAEAAAEDYEEVGGNPSSLTYSSDEVETMAAEAEDAERATEDALSVAEERYTGYASRAEEVVREAQALQESAGC